MYLPRACRARQKKSVRARLARLPDGFGERRRPQRRGVDARGAQHEYLSTLAVACAERQFEESRLKCLPRFRMRRAGQRRETKVAETELPIGFVKRGCTDAVIPSRVDSVSVAREIDAAYTHLLARKNRSKN